MQREDEATQGRRWGFEVLRFWFTSFCCRYTMVGLLFPYVRSENDRREFLGWANVRGNSTGKGKIRHEHRERSAGSAQKERSSRCGAWGTVSTGGNMFLKEK